MGIRRSLLHGYFFQHRTDLIRCDIRVVVKRLTDKERNLSHGDELLHAVIREVEEEMNLHVVNVRFNHSHYFAKSNTLMLNYTAIVDSMDVHENDEIDAYRWFSREEAAKNVARRSLAGDFFKG